MGGYYKVEGSIVKTEKHGTNNEIFIEHDGRAIKIIIIDGEYPINIKDGYLELKVDGR